MDTKLREQHKTWGRGGAVTNGPIQTPIEIRKNSHTFFTVLIKIVKNWNDLAET